MLVERKTISDFLPRRPQTIHSEKDLKPNIGKHENEDIGPLPSACAEKVCFSLAVKNDVEVTWNVKRRSGVTGWIVCCPLVIYPSIFQGQIQSSTEKSDSTCVTQPPNGPSINTAHRREMIRLRKAA